MLACLTSKGLMNRAHAYKAAVDKNLELERDPDDGINMGLYNYPVLMAADILLYGSDVVPVGPDQKQHIEITRDIAENFNRTYGKTLKLPEGLFPPGLQDVPGIDGRKMSKSYGNTIPIFADEQIMRKQVMRIGTDSRTPEEPKNPDGDNLFQIFRLFATPERTEEVRQHYLAGGLGYGTLKQELAETILAYFGDARQKFNDYMQDTAALDVILARGAEKARDIAIPVPETHAQSNGDRPLMSMTSSVSSTTISATNAANSAIRQSSLALISNVLLALMKTSVGILGHSPALLADGINSTSDVVYNIVVSAFVRAATNPLMTNTPTGTRSLKALRLGGWRIRHHYCCYHFLGLHQLPV